MESIHQQNSISSCVILGTDTGCGKTHISRQLLLLAQHNGQSAIGMKPVATGWNPNTPPETQEDIAALRAVSALLPPIDDQCPYLFPEPISPHLAAHHAGIEIDPSKIQGAYQRLQSIAQCIIVESAGGVLSPLNDTLDMADLPHLLSLPALLVIELRLGCINQGRLAAEALINRNVNVLGWIANRLPNAHIDFEEEVLSTLTRTLPFPQWKITSAADTQR